MKTLERLLDPKLRSCVDAEARRVLCKQVFLVMCDKGRVVATAHSTLRSRSGHGNSADSFNFKTKRKHGIVQLMPTYDCNHLTGKFFKNIPELDSVGPRLA